MHLTGNKRPLSTYRPVNRQSTKVHQLTTNHDTVKAGSVTLIAGVDTVVIKSIKTIILCITTQLQEHPETDKSWILQIQNKTEIKHAKKKKACFTTSAWGKCIRMLIDTNFNHFFFFLRKVKKITLLDFTLFSSFLALKKMCTISPPSFTSSARTCTDNRHHMLC